MQLISPNNINQQTPVLMRESYATVGITIRATKVQKPLLELWSIRTISTDDFLYSPKILITVLWIPTIWKQPKNTKENNYRTQHLNTESDYTKTTKELHKTLKKYILFLIINSSQKRHDLLQNRQNG